MNFIIDKEYQVNEVFKHEQTGKMLQVVKSTGHPCGEVHDLCALYNHACAACFCNPRERTDGVGFIHYREVTGPIEGMLYRAEGKLFRLVNRNRAGHMCACTQTNMQCAGINLEIFGHHLPGVTWYWEMMEEKEAKVPKVESKPATASGPTKPGVAVKRWIKLGPPRYEGAKVYFCIIEQSHVWNEFVPSGERGYKASNGYTLVSTAFPSSNGLNQCHVRGVNKLEDYRILIMAKEEYAKFAEAVEEYNVTNGCGLPKKERFPEEGETYYWIAGDGEVTSTQYQNDYSVDVIRKKIGNCFKTEKDTEYAASELKSTVKRVHEKLGY